MFFQKIINPDQTGYVNMMPVHGRKCQAYSTDIMFHAKHVTILGIALFPDFRKAFDITLARTGCNKMV